MINSSDISALILAGGKASRFNGKNKGLVPLKAAPMISYVIQALKPQVKTILISANRDIETYHKFGYPIIQDKHPEIDQLQGPLAGILQGMEYANTPWLLLSPCDTPFLQDDYCQKMIAALAAHPNRLAVASHQQKLQPLFALIPVTFKDSIENALHNKNYKVAQWVKSMPYIEVNFTDKLMFTNINSPDELAHSTKILDST